MTMIIETIAENFVWEFTGRHIGGKVAESLNLDHVNPHTLLMRKKDDGILFHFVFDYYGIRYHLLLARNEQVEPCEENILLNEIAECMEKDTSVKAVTAKCLDLFWSVVASDSADREGKTTERPTLKDRFREKETVKIQLVTIDGKLSRTSHSHHSIYPFTIPVDNPCPSTIPVLQMEDIELMDEMAHNVFKAKLGEQTVCVKGATHRGIRSELVIMMKLPSHPSLVPTLLGVVDAGQGCVDKFIIPFIPGKQLFRVKKASVQQKSVWKTQLSEAVSLLHSAGIVWGDGSTRNVMIDAGNEPW